MLLNPVEIMEILCVTLNLCISVLKKLCLVLQNNIFFNTEIQSNRAAWRLFNSTIR